MAPWRSGEGVRGFGRLWQLQKLMMLMKKHLGWYLGEHVTGIVYCLLWSDGFTSLRETDASLQIDHRSEHEITVDDGFVEVTGILQFFLK